MSALRRIDTDTLLHLSPIGDGTGTPQGNIRFDLVETVTNKESPYIYKEYRGLKDPPAYRRHVLALTSHIRRHPDIIKRVGAAPLMVVGRNTPGSFGVLMRRVPGDPLQELESTLAELPLRVRLEMALELATTVAILHGHNIIHADLTDANILCCPTATSPPKISLIDMDLAIVPGNRDTNPMVIPKEDSHFHAPEIYAGKAIGSSVSTDRWALASAVHQILIRPLPVNFANPKDSIEDYARFLVDNKAVHVWPKPLATNASPALKAYHRLLNRLDREIKGMFRRTFDQTLGRNLPEHRPTATAWVQALDQALSNLYICRNGGCVNHGELVVALDKRCPICTKKSLVLPPN